MQRQCLCLLLMLGLAGCAFSEDVAEIRYSPNAAHRMAGAGPIAVTASDGRTSFRTRVAMKQNGFGMDGAAIRTSRPVTDIVRDAISAELGQRGFTLQAGGRAVDVSVTVFYDFFGDGLPAGGALTSLSYFGDSHGQVGLTVSIAGARPFSRHYDGIGNETVMITSGDNAAHALTAGLHAAVDKMFADPDFMSAIAGPATS